MKQSLQSAEHFAKAFTKLLYPFAEAVIHDLERGCIIAIFNPLSKREVGDPSYLDEIDLEATTGLIIGPYSKTNWDGRPMKSISIALKNHRGDVEGMLCVNIDVSSFLSALTTLQNLLHNELDGPTASEQIFQDDLHDRINKYVQKYCYEHQLCLDRLTREERRKLIHALAEDGALSGKHAATYISRVLGLSRATVYNYLKEGV